jgi:hypothetical protein
MKWQWHFVTHWESIGLGVVFIETRCDDPACGELHGYNFELTFLCWSLCLEGLATP